MNMNIMSAIQTARKFLDELGYTGYKIVQAVPNEQKVIWEIAVNIGVFSSEIRFITIDDKNGTVVQLR